MVVHGLFFLTFHHNHVMALPSGTQSTRLSINMAAVPPIIAIEQVPEKSELADKQHQIETKPTAVKKLVNKIDKQKMKEPRKKNTAKESEQVIKKAAKKVEDVAQKQRQQPLPAITASSSGIEEPRLIAKPSFSIRPSPIRYPSLAKRQRHQGKAVIEVWIDAKGQQIKQTIIESTGTKILDNAAISAIKQWHFSAYIIDGVAVPHRVNIPVRFKLD